MKWFFLFLLTILPTTASAGGWTIDYNLSTLTFTATQQGHKFDGQFNKFRADVVLDPAAPETGNIKVTVDTRSVSAGNRDRNQALPQREWFYADKFPQAVFESSAIRKKPDGYYEADGKLTIKDVTKDVTIPFTLVQEEKRAIAEGSIVLQRDQFNIGIGEWGSDEWIAFPVSVTFRLIATPLAS